MMRRLGRLRKASFTFKWLMLISTVTATVSVWNTLASRPLTLKTFTRTRTLKTLSQKITSVNGTNLHSLPQTFTATNYVVFDASHRACAELEFLRRVPMTWMVLLLNDCAEGMAFKSCPRCVSLPQSWVKENVYNKLTSKTPEVEDDPVLTRMAAALYLTSLGASWVFFSDREIPIPFSVLKSVINRSQITNGLLYRHTDQKLRFEPCSHFMDPYTWKGKPTLEAPPLFDLVPVPPSTVYHVIRGCVEDCQLTGASQEDLDLGAPPAYVQHGTFAVSVLSNLLVPVQQLWALLPAILFSSTEPQLSVHHVTTHSNLSLLVQRILFETEGHLGFLQARVSDTAPKHASGTTAVKSADARNIIREQNKATRFSKWTCPPDFNVTWCLKTLADSLASGHHLDVKILQYVNIWVHLLGKQVSTRRILYRYKTKRLVSPVYFTPAPRKPRGKLEQGGGDKMEQLCHSEEMNYFSVFPSKHKITDMVLVIVMNYPKLVSNIPIMEYVYGRHFKRMIYCAESKENFKDLYLDRAIKYPVSFIEASVARGLNGYRCITIAMTMGYRVNGFLQASDDVLINVWNLQVLPRNMPWFQSNFRVAALESPSVPDLWLAKEWGPWTSKDSGRDAAVNFYQYLQRQSTDSVQGRIVASFITNLFNATGCTQCVMYEASDIFYIPAHLTDNFHFFSSLMLRYNVHLEIAVPTILNGLTLQEHIYRLRGFYLWFEKRKFLADAYSDRDHFLHPFKYQLLAYQKFVKFFCEKYLESLDVDLFSGRP